MARPHIPIPELSTQDINRFNRYVLKGDSDECWPWQAIRTKRGYGGFKCRRKMMTAHRIAYAISKGDPGKMLVCHTCDNPPCCNPRHLFLGTYSDNIIDARDKGRLRCQTGDNHYTRRCPELLKNRKRRDITNMRRGDSHYASKVTSEQVKEIQNVYAEGYDTMEELGETYGITPSSVWAIIHKTKWKHV